MTQGNIRPSNRERWLQPQETPEKERQREKEKKKWERRRKGILNLQPALKQPDGAAKEKEKAP